MTEQLFVYTMPVAGNVYHARAITDAIPSRMALCGYQPRSRRPLPQKGHWDNSYRSGDPSQGRPVASSICPRCVRKLTKLGVLP
jgi:hypothetical protein